MEKILIAKAKKYASTATVEETALTPDLLVEGSIGIYGFNSAGKMALISNTAATDNTAGAYIVNKADFAGKEFMFALGNGSKGPILSDPIRIADVQRAQGFEYVAPVKQVKTITFTNPGTGNAYDTFQVIVSKGNPTRSVQKTYIVTGIFANVTAINDALRTAISEDDNAFVVGSGTTTLILTDKNFLAPVKIVASTRLFGTATTPVEAAVTPANTTDYSAGSGYWKQVAAIEREMQIAKGYWDNRETTTVKPKVNAVEDATYDLYMIDQALTQQTNTDNYKAQPSNTVLAFPDGDYDAASEGQGAVVDILTTILGTKVIALSGDAESITVDTGKFVAGANDGA